MSEGQKNTAALVSAIVMVLGGLSSVGSLAFFFGGSDRDPQWMFALYLVLLLGGALACIVGLVCLLVSLARQ